MQQHQLNTLAEYSEFSDEWLQKQATYLRQKYEYTDAYLMARGYLEEAKTYEYVLILRNKLKGE
jgi:hypothetical protein